MERFNTKNVNTYYTLLPMNFEDRGMNHVCHFSMQDILEFKRQHGLLWVDEGIGKQKPDEYMRGYCLYLKRKDGRFTEMQLVSADGSVMVVLTQEHRN